MILGSEELQALCDHCKRYDYVSIKSPVLWTLIQNYLKTHPDALPDLAGTDVPPSPRILQFKPPPPSSE